MDYYSTFSVIGCGDMVAPLGGWVQRDGEELVLGCHSGSHTWTLTCDGNQWQGTKGQCGTGTIFPLIIIRILFDSFDFL